MGVHWSNRREENLRYLNACYVDLDLYRVGLTATQGRAAIEELVGDGRAAYRSLRCALERRGRSHCVARGP